MREQGYVQFQSPGGFCMPYISWCKGICIAIHGMSELALIIERTMILSLFVGFTCFEIATRFGSQVFLVDFEVFFTGGTKWIERRARDHSL